MKGETKAEPSVDIRSHSDPTDRLGGQNLNTKPTTVRNIVSVNAAVESPNAPDMPDVSHLTR